jgi:hypothetical protein
MGMKIPTPATRSSFYLEDRALKSFGFQFP